MSEHSILDQALVVALSISALVSLVFLVFVIPILVQLARTFELTNSLLTLTKNSASEVALKVNNATRSAEKFSSDLSSKIIGIKAGFENFFKKKPAAAKKIYDNNQI
jgi:hypothetical protein